MTNNAWSVIEERRNAPASNVMTKDFDPVPFQKADSESGVLGGYGSKFWVVDSYGEVTAPGSFSKSITDRGPKSESPRIVLRYEHYQTIGTHTALEEDGDGLKLEAHISDDGMFGTAVRAHLRDSVPYGMSIGFRRVAQRSATEADPLLWDHAPQYIVDMAKQDISNILVLTEVKLLENSVVTFPAVDNALVTDYRSELDLTQRALDKLFADVKAGRLGPDHISYLKRITALVPADSTPSVNGEMPNGAGRSSDSPTGVRNYQSEARMLLLGLSVG